MLITTTATTMYDSLLVQGFIDPTETETRQFFSHIKRQKKSCSPPT